MTTLHASSAPIPAVASSRLGVFGVVVSTATALALLALAILPLLTPTFIHPAMDASSSEIWAGTTRDEAHALSDATVQELVFGPGTFAIQGPGGGPLYTDAEASHLRDARTLLWAFLAVGATSAVLVVAALARTGGRRAMWRAVARGAGALAVGVVVLGVVGWFAFEPAFELFHRILFPGGNWAFDLATDRLVQLYPYVFWQIAAAATGVLASVLGLVVWAVARRLGRPVPVAGAEAGGSTV